MVESSSPYAALPGSANMTDETEVDRWRGALLAKATSVIAAINLIRPDNVKSGSLILLLRG